MSSRTLSLSLLVLLCAAFPAQLFRVGLAMTLGPAPGAGKILAQLRRLWLPGAFLLVAGLVWYVAPASGVLAAPVAWWWCAVAVAVGLAAPGVEVGVGAATALARGRRPVRVRLHERWQRGGAAGGLAVTTALLVAVAEEVIFRGVGLYLLRHELAMPAVLAVAVAALVYALNHLYFGWLTVGQKLVTGVLFGWLFLASGGSVLVPVLAHVAQNVLVVAVLPRWFGGGSAGRPAADQQPQRVPQ
ncbi:CPBP family intramembrane metalloprotease [Natronosporangium hydrolyticum]|uniref:CPBP family intramembrane metalloprotease n=1 Tax=Natronosporangium hydrolyticum TaxID=2811111 RepID=A0A895Y5M5_9ACTN|nr:CPBP family intramembrane glutamic endopeptidase [Natronosporangium hydrolyticum]QSB12701.1 CPBP family intramembrane metalloprotease [Natronosporangium hydrolyticum]